jgi:hypothetical protein
MLALSGSLRGDCIAAEGPDSSCLDLTGWTCAALNPGTPGACRTDWEARPVAFQGAGGAEL